MAVVGIIPAAGRGGRLGVAGPKAFVCLAGRPMVEWSLDVLRDVCEEVLVAVPADLVGGGPGRVPGGSSRSESVALALAAAPQASIAVVHDAARPLVTRDLVVRCIDALSEGVDGAIAATRVTDTVKEADGGARVVRTLDRSALWAAQTPQVFRADVLRDALVGDVSRATDDASLVEAAGGTVVVVEAPAENMKVTTPLDLRVAEMLLAERA